jgi:hypothetical protein
MKKYLYRIIVILILAFSLSLPVLAEGSLGDAGTALNNAGRQAGTEQVGDINLIIGGIVKIALSLIGLIFFVLVVYAGYLWMIARGEEEKAKKAQKIIIDSLIGLVIVISGYAITVLVLSQFAN